MGKKITYDIGFNVDKNGLKTAQQELQKISNMSESGFRMHGITSDFKEIKTAASQLQGILERSFNTQLGTYNIKTLHKEILALGQNGFKKLQQDILKAKELGVGALSDLATEVLTTNNAFAKSSKLLSDLGKTLGNTIKWSISSSLINAFTGSIQKAWNYTQKLDESLNNIRIVTGKSAEDMENFAKQANKAAKSLGASTTSYTNAALIYYQQGLGEKDVQARTKTTLKAANVTGQSAAEVSEQLTAVWNGYKVVAEEAELYVDKLAAVAATTAADLEELSTGMSKVASAANAMGVDVDQLSAQLATIVSVTRQDASVVGTALKTIYSRMGDLKVSGVDEFGASLGDVSGQLKQMGINVLDESGNLRDMGIVIEEVAAKWGTWTDAQQQAAAVAIAGKRQYNNLIALFENWDMYESALGTSQTSAGTLQKQQETYMDSLEAKLQKLSVSAEKFYDNLIDTEATKGFIELLSGLVDVLADVVKGFGGAGGVITQFGSILLRVFSGQVIDGFKKTFYNINVLWDTFWGNTQRFQKDLAKEFNVDFSTDGIKEAAALREQELTLARHLTDEEKERYEYLIKQRIELGKNKAELEAKNTDLTRQANGFGLNLASYEDDEASNPNIRAKNKIKINKKKKELKDLKETVKNSTNLKALAASLQMTLGESTTAGEELRVLIGDWPDGIDASKEAMEQLLEILKEAESELDEIGVSWDEIQQKIQKTGGSTKKTKEQMEALKKEGEKRAIQGAITDTVSTAMAAISIFTTVNSLIEDTKNGSLSVMEVIGTIFSLVISGAPAVIGCIKLIATTATGAAKAISMSLGIVGIIGVAAAILIPLISSLITTQESALDKANKALEKAKENADAARKSFSSLTEEVETLASAMSSLKQKQFDLGLLVPGSQDYKNTLEQINKEVLDLVEKYPQLASALKFENGRFTLEDEALEKLQQDLDMQKRYARSDIFAAQEGVYQTAGEALKEDFYEKIKQFSKNTTNFEDSTMSWIDRTNNPFVIGQGKSEENNFNPLFYAMNDLNKSGYGTGNMFANADLRDLLELSTDSLITLSGQLGKNNVFSDLVESAIEVKKSLDNNNKAVDELNNSYRALLGEDYNITSASGLNTWNSLLKEKGINALTQTSKNKSLGEYGLNFAATAYDESMWEREKGHADHLDLESDKAIFEEFIREGDEGTVQHAGSTLDAEWEVKAINESLKDLAEDAGLTLNNGIIWANVKDKNIPMKELADYTDLVTVNGQKMTIRDFTNFALQKIHDSKGASDKTAIANAMNVAEKAGYSESAGAFAFGAEDILEVWSGVTIANPKKGSIISGEVFESDIKEQEAKDFGKNVYSNYWTGATLGEVQEIAANGLAFSDEELGVNVNFSSSGPVLAGFYEAFMNAAQDSWDNGLAGKESPYSFSDIVGKAGVQNFSAAQFGELAKYIDTKYSDGKTSVFSNEVLSSANETALVLSLLQGDAAAREKYRSQLGVSADFGKKIKEDQTEEYMLGLEIRNMTIDRYKQELDYLKEVSTEMDRAFGSDRLDKMRQFTTTSEEVAARDQNFFKKLFENTGLDINQMGTNGSFDYNTFLNYYAKLQADSGEDSGAFEEAETIKEAYEKAEESAWAVVDAKFEEYKYQMDIVDQSKELADKWRDLNKELSSLNGESFQETYKYLIDKWTSEQSFYDVQYGSRLSSLDISNFSYNGYQDAQQFYELNKTIIDGAIGSLEKMISIIGELFKAWETGLKEIQDSYDKIINKVKDFTTLVQGAVSMSKVVGGGLAYGDLSQYYNLVITANQGSLALSERKVNDLLEVYQTALKNNDEKLIASTKKALMDATTEVTQWAGKQYQLIIERFNELTLKAVDDALGSSGALAKMSLDWSLEMAKDEMYLDAVNRAYALDDLKRNIQKSIDSSSSVFAQEKLNKLMKEQVSLLEQKEKLTQYDVDRANALYDITLKQIALEEAQQAANKMKLTRDAFGNYTYQYVQDTDAIAEAESALAAANNNLYNLDKDKKKELIEEFFNMWQEYSAKMAEAMATGDDALQQRVWEHYFGANGMLTMIKSELGLIEGSSEAIADLFEQNVDFSNAVISFKVEGSELQNVFNSTVTAINSLERSLGQVFGKDGAIYNALDTISTGLFNKEGKLDLPNNESLISSMGELANNINSYIGIVQGLTENLGTFINQYQGKLLGLDENTKAVNNLTGAILDFADKWDGTSDNTFGNWQKGDHDDNAETPDTWQYIVANDNPV